MIHLKGKGYDTQMQWSAVVAVALGLVAEVVVVVVNVAVIKWW